MKEKNNTPKIIVAVLVVSFFLNLLWEVAHSLLYDWNDLPLQNTVQFYVPKILMASLGDVMYVFIILLLLSLFRRGFIWILNPKGRDYVSLIMWGILFAIFIEIKAETLGLWSYNSYMPLIFGIGLTPLIQLAITSSVSLFIINNFMKGGNKR